MFSILRRFFITHTRNEKKEGIIHTYVGNPSILNIYIAFCDTHTQQFRRQEATGSPVSIPDLVNFTVTLSRNVAVRCPWAILLAIYVAPQLDLLYCREQVLSFFSILYSGVHKAVFTEKYCLLVPRDGSMRYFDLEAGNVFLTYIQTEYWIYSFYVYFKSQNRMVIDFPEIIQLVE